MKFLWVFVGLFFSANALAQTKRETQAWIIKQTEVNPPGLKYSIEEDELVIHFILALDTIKKGIPISKVKTIFVTHTNHYLSYSLMCDSPCTYLLDDPETKQPKFLFEIYQKLDPTFVPRMNKALLHLIRLNGGNAAIVKQAAESLRALLTSVEIGSACKSWPV